MQSVGDGADYVLSVVYARLATMGYIPQEALNWPQGNIAFAALSGSFHFQFAAHTAIAVNRFLVLKDVSRATAFGT
ncbi:hypothetical protein AAVH_22544 [Aphelenchoides avenae]|nr:hypothetical protein AAVH_22544 [Aphelenchus avenae]